MKRWVKNPYWPYFYGFQYLQHKFPLHSSSLVRWRNRVGSKLDALLKQTIELALN
ncbi:transposase [Candidatus Vondammii sp. HM_W22]|uniref:transposase n=1 Tax=Candidatus Vondammii sp. HM_W22 TaxID=2687299 RepID=UPI00403DE980